MKKVNLIMIIVWSLIGVVILAALVLGVLFNWGGGIRSGTDNLNAQLVVNEAISAKDLDTVKIDLASDMCSVLSTDGDNILVKHYARGISNDHYAKVSQQNGTFTVSTANRGFNINMFNFFALNNYSMIEVYLPENYREKLDIRISSGTLTVENALDLSELGIKISSGTIRADDFLKATVANINVNSGSVRLSDGLESDEYGIDINSGTVNIDNLKGSGKIDVNSGSIKLSGVDIKDFLNVKVSSGTIGIELTGNPSLAFTGHQSSGTLHTYFANFNGDGGNFSATTGEAPYKQLDVRVNSGTIRITHD